MLITTEVDDSLIFLCNFSKKIRVGISCELSARQWLGISCELSVRNEKVNSVFIYHNNPKYLRQAFVQVCLPYMQQYYRLEWITIFILPAYEVCRRGI